MKPENVLCNPQIINARICDLGSAKPLPNHNGAIEKLKVKKGGSKRAVIREGYEKRGSVFYISTRHYRAPELILGNKYYGFEVDLWAVGCVMSEFFSIEHDNYDSD